MSLLENEDYGKVTMEDWLPQSAAKSSTQQEQEELNKFWYPKNDQRILSMGVERPQREHWTTFPRNNPFEDEAWACGSSDPGQEESKKTVCKATISKLTQHQRSFSQNPFESPKKPSRRKTVTNFEINQSFQINLHSQNEAAPSYLRPPGMQQKQVRRANSMLGSLPLVQDPQQGQFQRKPQQIPTQYELHNTFKEQKDCMEEKIHLVPGEPSLDALYYKDYNSQDIVNKKRKKNKKSKKSKSKKSKKVMWNTESFSDDQSNASISCEKKLSDVWSGHKTNAIAELLRGMVLLKFPRTGRSAPHFKWVQLTRGKSNLYLQWFSKRKPLRLTTINVARIDRVLQGTQSLVFVRFGNRKVVQASFSVIYNQGLSLSLVAKGVDECKMWVTCINELISLAKLGQDLTFVQSVWLDLNYIDKNRPRRHLKGKKPKRANMVPGKVNKRLHKKSNFDVMNLRARCNKLLRISDLGRSKEYGNLMLSLKDLQERLVELTVETRESCNSEMSRHDIWRFTVNLKALEEKTNVLRRSRGFNLA